MRFSFAFFVLISAVLQFDQVEAQWLSREVIGSRRLFRGALSLTSKPFQCILSHQSGGAA